MQVRRALIATAATLAFANMASGTIITLSDLSSDDTPAEDLKATFLFTVTGNSLSIAVTNDTMAPNEFNINEFYFNASDNVTGLTLDSVDGSPIGQWDLTFDQMGDGFGTFDFAVTRNSETQNHHINAGETVTFNFTFTGTADKMDFVDEFSVPPANPTAILAAKFVNGPSDDSAFGAAIPSPGTLALLALAGVLLGRRRRRAA